MTDDLLHGNRRYITRGRQKAAANGTPAPKESDAMERFENRICKHIEKTEQAVLCNVFTEPGDREYVFHCEDVQSFLAALSEMPQESAPYPNRNSSRDRCGRQVL